MKPSERVLMAAKARLRQAVGHVSDVSDAINEMQTTGHSGPQMAKLRTHAQQLLQCVHEYNAYRNAAAECEDSRSVRQDA